MWGALGKKLICKGYKVKIFESKLQVKKYIIEKIGENKKIGISGSDSILDLDVDNILKKKNMVYWHWLEKNKEDKIQVKHQSRDVDYYLSSVNAITEDGSMILIDGVGNRISALSYGPKETIIVIGKNKYCNSIEEGIKRIKDIVAPVNAKKMGLNVPCTILGNCINCNSKDRMCNILGVFYNKPRESCIEIILVNENLGI